MCRLVFVVAASVALLVTPAAAQDDPRPELRVGLAEVQSSYDPGASLAFRLWHVNYSIFDTLTERRFEDGVGGELVPALATDWRRIDERTLDVTLREGVTFHNGEPLTSEDVVFTFERLQDPELPYAATGGRFSDLTVEAIDDFTVRFQTELPHPFLEARLRSAYAMIVPKDYFEEVGQAAFQNMPIGTGPYRLVEFSPEERVVLEAFDDYWGEPAPASRIVFEDIPELSARITALVNGEVDIISDLIPDQLRALEGREGIDVRGVTANNVHILVYNTRHPAMGDPLFRQALNLAIDRERMAEALWQGRATVPNGYQIAAMTGLYDANRPTPAFDPERARNLVEQSSYDGETITFNAHPVYYTLGVQAAEAIVQMWRDIGVDAELIVSEDVWQVRNDRGEMADTHTMRVSSTSLLEGDTMGLLTYAFGPDGWVPARGLWDVPEDFTALYREAEASTDLETRFTAHSQLLDIFEEQAPGTFFYQWETLNGVRSDIDWMPYNDLRFDFRARNLSFN